MVWGCYHGTLLIIERSTGLARSTRMLGPRRAITFVLVIIGWVVFRSESLPVAGDFLSAMLLGSPGSADALTVAPDLDLLLTPYRIALLCLVCGTALLPGTWVAGKIIDGLEGAAGWARTTATSMATLLAPYSAMVAVAGTYSPFLYFKF